MGGGVTYLGLGYLPWLGGTYLSQGVPTLDGGGYLPWTGYATDSMPFEAFHWRTFLFPV